MQRFGYLRRSQAFVDEFNYALEVVGLCATPAFDIYLPIDERIYISIKGVSTSQVDSMPVSEVEIKDLSQAIQVKHDFFYYLFDFGSDQEYERFQACLDSNQPIGIFLVPLEKDFFSSVVVKVLSYELVRKYQYKGMYGGVQSSNLSFNTSVQSEATQAPDNPSTLSSSNIFHFDRATMTNVLLGTSGLELLDSEKFDEQFSQLSLYANKYNSEQFFIVFHCPSELEIQAQQREDLFGYLTDKVASQIPFTFVLRCKYEDEQSIQEIENIRNHFRLLLEVPQNVTEEDDISLLDYFLELQKAQVQAESQLLLRMQPEHFEILTWGYESDEHIYLKYFAIKTLENIGFDLSQIRCEVLTTKQLQKIQANESNLNNQEIIGDETDIKRRPDVCVENKIIVEVETLRGKGFNGENVFLDLIDRILVKSSGWTNKLENVWLVLPGFEIARNYYQLKKVEEILQHHLIPKYGSSFKLLIMAPDYENQQLLSISFDSIEYPSFKYLPNQSRKKSTVDKLEPIKLNFDRVKGLHEEKERLNRLLKLQSQGLGGAIGGILFFGLPGCGKTLLANAFANQSNRYFFKFSPADIQSMYIGQSQKNIRDIFAQAKKKAPSVLFIDELDSIGFSRSELQAHTDQKATINQLLIELNNIKDSDVIVIAATNYLSGIDAALKRSGRFDWKIPIFPPDSNERKEIFEYYLSQIKVNLDLVNFDALAERSCKFTSSDIELVCREVRNAILLGDVEATLTTSDVITFISNLQDGGLTLSQEQVEEFLDECKRLSVKNPKLESLRAEWA
jgi:AAA+ superfamily predicted ATPase